MATSNPKLEARMANISTATAYFPGELAYAGTNAIHTAKKINMLKVINFASLKLSGRFLARKANRKLTAANSPMYPSSIEKPATEPIAHSYTILERVYWLFLYGVGEAVDSQTAHITTWRAVRTRTVHLC